MTTPAKLLDLLSSLRAKRRAAEEEMARVDEALNAVEETMALLRSQDEAHGDAETPGPAPFSPADFEGKSQLEAIVMLAERNDGVVTVKDAKRMLLETRLTESKKSASQVASSTIIRCGRFTWVGPGTYRLSDYRRLRAVS